MSQLRYLALLLALIVSAPVASDISVQDDLNREVRLSAPAQRIVTLSPHATEMLLAIGAENRLVAVAQFFDYPQSMQDIPKINSLGGLDREQILTYKPDLVIAWASGNHPGDLQWLQRSAIPVFMSEPATILDIATTLSRLGTLVGKPEKGKLAADNFRSRIATACHRRSNAPMETVYYEIWTTPPMSIGGKHWLNEILQLAHLQNVFSDVPRAVFTLSAESLLATPVQVIVTGQPDRERWSTKTRVIAASPTLGRPGPRIAEGLEQLCQQL
jgi:iron complex transport system substrate-binding protein